MEVGIQLATSSEAWKIVQRTEELGFNHDWFYDTQLLCAAPFLAMAAAAMKTSKIRLATGVLIPSNRIAPAAACAFASLNQLAPGRIDFRGAGVGKSFAKRGSDHQYFDHGDDFGNGQSRYVCGEQIGC
jgi:5,10-methylenetetrahydromethanopterin reductase